MINYLDEQAQVNILAFWFRTTDLSVVFMTNVNTLKSKNNTLIASNGMHIDAF